VELKQSADYLGLRVGCGSVAGSVAWWSPQQNQALKANKEAVGEPLLASDAWICFLHGFQRILGLELLQETCRSSWSGLQPTTGLFRYRVWAHLVPTTWASSGSCSTSSRDKTSTALKHCHDAHSSMLALNFFRSSSFRLLGLASNRMALSVRKTSSAAWQ